MIIGSEYLTARDVRLLCAVGHAPFLSGPELGALFFAERDAPRPGRMRRLRQLRRRELLVSPPRQGSRAPALFALTPAGLTACVARADMSPDTLAVFTPKTLPSPLLHFRLLARTFTALSLAVRANTAMALADFFGEHFFKQPDNFDRLKTADGRRVPVIPDGLFILRRHSDGKRKFIFTEADTGTENLGRIARKIRGYEAYRTPAGSRAFEARFHAPPVFEVLFITPGNRRANNLRRTTAAIAAPERHPAYRFTTPDTLLRPFDADGSRRHLLD